jgi:ERCC4-type nuclease
MMLLLDYRDGSKELEGPLKRAGLPVEVTDLTTGDLMWIGRGEGGKSVTVGVEFKKLADLITSIRTERLQGFQLPAMRSIGDDGLPAFDFAYLLIEGQMEWDTNCRLLKRSKWGKMAPWPGAMPVPELLKRLNVLHLRGGLNRIMTTNRQQTVQEIVALYRTWTDADLDEHKSHLAIYNPEPLIPVSEQTAMLARLPGCGFKVAKAAIHTFGTVERAVLATVDEWAAVTTKDKSGKTRRLGTATAERIKQFLKRSVT